MKVPVRPPDVLSRHGDILCYKNLLSQWLELINSTRGWRGSGDVWKHACGRRPSLPPKRSRLFSRSAPPSSRRNAPSTIAAVSQEMQRRFLAADLVKGLLA